MLICDLFRSHLALQLIIIRILVAIYKTGSMDSDFAFPGKPGRGRSLLPVDQPCHGALQGAQSDRVIDFNFKFNPKTK